jgi:hypothetical protein
MERQRCTHRIGAALASVVPGSRHQVPARREFLWNDYRRVVWLTFAYAHSACARKSNVRTRARSCEAMKTDLPVPRARPPTAARGSGCNFGAPDLQSRGCLDGLADRHAKKGPPPPPWGGRSARGATQSWASSGRTNTRAYANLIYTQRARTCARQRDLKLIFPASANACSACNNWTPGAWVLFAPHAGGFGANAIRTTVGFFTFGEKEADHFTNKS